MGRLQLDQVGRLQLDQVGRLQLDQVGGLAGDTRNEKPGARPGLRSGEIGLLVAA